MPGRNLVAALLAASASLAACAQPRCDGVEAHLSVATGGSGTGRVIAQVSATERPRPALALLQSRRDAAAGVVCIDPGPRRVISARAYDRGGRITHTGARIVDVGSSFELELRPRCGGASLVLHAESPEASTASASRGSRGPGGVLTAASSR